MERYGAAYDAAEKWYWKARLLKDAPFVPIVSWYGPPIIDGEEVDRSYRFQILLRLETTSRRILFGDMTPIEAEDISLRNLERIEKEEYDFMRAHADWAVKHAPHMPDAAPRSKINKRGPSIF